MRDLECVVLSIFTPFQLLVAQNIIAQQYSSNPVYVIDHRRNKANGIDASHFPNLVECHELDASGSLREQSFRDNLTSAIRFAREAISKHRAAVLLLASLEWGPNNAIYAANRSNPSLRVEMIEDGMSTYLAAKAPIKQKIRRMVRFIYGALHGIPYRLYFNGHALGLDLQDVSRVHVSAPELLSHSGGKTTRMQWPMSDQATVPASGLFLTQPYTAQWGDAYLECVTSFFAASGTGIMDWAVKFHHFSTDDEVSHFTSLGYQRLDTLEPLEQVIMRSSYGVICSVNSTALLTAKLILGDRVRCVAICPTRFYPKWEQRDDTDLLGILLKAGVEVWDRAEASSEFSRVS